MDSIKPVVPVQTAVEQGSGDDPFPDVLFIEAQTGITLEDRSI